MNAIQVFQLMMTRWSPGLNKETSSKYDDEFNACIEQLQQALSDDQGLYVWAYASRIAALSSILSGQAELRIPLAEMLWEEWAERLLKLEIELVSANTTAARHAYRRLSGACVAAQHYLDRPGWQQ